jgi:hypothetical protein
MKSVEDFALSFGYLSRLFAISHEKKYLLTILIYITFTHIHPTDAEFTSIHIYYSVHLLQEVV